MTKFFLFCLLLLFGSTWLRAQAGSFLTLKDCYEKALKKSEAIAVDEEIWQQAKAQYRETLGDALPELLFKYSAVWQDQSGLDGSGSLGSFTQSPQTESNFKIRKNLFTGYKELAAVMGGSSYVQQKRYDKERAVQILLSEVAEAFYGALQAEANLNSTQMVHSLAQGRLEELKTRARVGRTREADVQAMAYQVASLETQVLEAERVRETRLETLSFFIGEEIAPSLQDEKVNSYDLTSLEDYLKLLPNRLDIHSKLEAVKVAQAAVRVARAGHFPQIDLSLNYYLERTGFRKPIDWDVNLGMEVPLWSWRAVESSIRKAESVLGQREKELEEAKRKVEVEIKNAYRNYVYAHKSLDLYRKALAFARKEYELQVQDYKFNLVTNVEVLDSMNRLFQAELSANNAALQASMTEIELKVAAGLEAREILNP